MNRSLEREMKFEVGLHFVLPSLDPSFGASEPSEDLHLRTAYFDTADFRLWRRGITLRHRAEGEPDGGVWTAKLPASGGGPTLDRTEVTWTGSRSAMPWEVNRLLRGMVRGAPLEQIVELVTTRRRITLRDEAGTPVGELDDDYVTVVGGAREGRSFRQIEIEIGPTGSGQLRRLVKRLEVEGAQSGGEEKLAKALDLPARPRGDEPAVPPEASVEDVVRASIADARDRLLDHEYRIRLDPSDPPVEAVHQARVACRRLRSQLKLLAPALEAEWVGRVREDLKWLGGVLGRVRDADVLASSVARDADGSGFDDEGHAELRAALAAQRVAQCRSLATALDDRRYLALLDALDDAVDAVPAAVDGDRQAGGRPMVTRAARRVLPGLVRRRWRSLRRAVRKAGPHPSDRELHVMRIRAKELRYAAELSVPVIGRAARRTALGAETAQTVLGDHQDAVNAELWLRGQAMEGPLSASYSAGRLASEQARARRRLRRRWRAVWRRLRRKRFRSWY